MTKQHDYDEEIVAIADYVYNFNKPNELAEKTAYYDLLDSLACAFLALQFPACTKLLGPLVPGGEIENGARVPGTGYQLDPVQAAFNIGTLIRWLDYNDTWLAAEWGHPSDNLGGILATTDYLMRTKQRDFCVRDILLAMIKAHEIQGVLALENSFNRVGLDHVLLVKVATAAVVSELFGATHEQACAAISQAWLDGQSLRTYRHAPNTGSRKSWAAGDATSRAVRLCLLTLAGEMGYPSALSAKAWGFHDVSFGNKALVRSRDYKDYVMENVLFKIAYPAEFHAQTAVEAAFQLHPEIRDRLDEITAITIRTQEPAVRIISKQGPLTNPADRDHCLEYMVAVALLHGKLTAESYEDAFAEDPRIDRLREKMHVEEETQMTKDYYDPDKRAIGNAIQIEFSDGSQTQEIRVDYPIGHRCRRDEGIPLLMEKFTAAVEQSFSPKQTEAILTRFGDPETLKAMSIVDFMDALTVSHSKLRSISE